MLLDILTVNVEIAETILHIHTATGHFLKVVKKESFHGEILILHEVHFSSSNQQNFLLEFTVEKMQAEFFCKPTIERLSFKEHPINLIKHSLHFCWSLTIKFLEKDNHKKTILLQGK